MSSLHRDCASHNASRSRWRTCSHAHPLTPRRCKRRTIELLPLPHPRMRAYPPLSANTLNTVASAASAPAPRKHRSRQQRSAAQRSAAQRSTAQHSTATPDGLAVGTRQSCGTNAQSRWRPDGRRASTAWPTFAGTRRSACVCKRGVLAQLSSAQLSSAQRRL